MAWLILTFIDELLQTYFPLSAVTRILANSGEALEYEKKKKKDYDLTIVLHYAFVH